MNSKKESAKRGKKGMGTIRKTKVGNYEYRISYYDEFNKRKIKSFTCPTVDQCVAKAEKFKEEMKYKQGIMRRDTTLGDIIRQKIDSDHARNFTGESGYDRNLKTLATIERDGIGKIPIKDISNRQMEEYLKYITRYANTVIRKMYGMIKAAYKIAYDVGLISFNFMLLPEFRCPKSVKKDKKIRALTDDEQKAFVDALTNHKKRNGRNEYSLQLLIELYAGLRMGEINALKPEDINLEKGYIHVTQTISRGMNYRSYIKEGTKTYAGERDVPINNTLRPILEKALEKAKDNPQGTLFYDYEKDGLIETSQVNCFYRRICETAGIEYNGQHSLRHTFATRCIEAGVAPVVLKKWLGHTNIHITLDTYSDVFDKMNFDATDKFDTLMESLNEK